MPLTDFGFMYRLSLTIYSYKPEALCALNIFVSDWRYFS